MLCNLLFKDREEAPVNAVKKRTVLATLLQNMKAPFAGKTVIAGANLAYAPLDLSKQANQYRTERAGSATPIHLQDLPIGEQTFAGVKFDVYEFATSPRAHGGDARRPRRAGQAAPAGRAACPWAARPTPCSSCKPRESINPLTTASGRRRRTRVGRSTSSTMLTTRRKRLGLEIDVDSYRQASPLKTLVRGASRLGQALARQFGCLGGGLCPCSGTTRTPRRRSPRSTLPTGPHSRTGRSRGAGNHGRQRAVRRGRVATGGKSGRVATADGSVATGGKPGRVATDRGAWVSTHGLRAPSVPSVA